MRKGIMLLMTVLWLAGGFLAHPAASLGDTAPPPEGGVLPAMKLPVPPRLQDKEYLGVKDGPYFTVSDARAEVVILEVFSMYCPFCQKEAPNVNELENLISKRPELSDKIKLIGIGAGNSIFEVNAFRNLYRIGFALIPDGDYTFHQALGEVRTPYFIVVRINPDKTHKVVYSRVGGFGDPQAFLDLVIERTGLKTGE